MTEPKHTPGPWKLSRVDHGVVMVADGPSTGMEIATVRQFIPAYKEQSDANARLIAAAPELLDALIALLRQVDIRCGGKAEGRSDLVRAADASRAAIAKAKGETK